ncbi:MAG TPA: hypothetical protein VE865_13845 [Bradyrhizobium sp.]|nr:hypothetical protein [Bradyrhizobium sp.]
MKHLLGGMLLAALAGVPAFAEEAEFAPNLALLQNAASVSSIRSDRASAERDTALIKEGESDSPDTVAAIERNREDRERSAVMDQ